jgi:hypothetical protein
MEYRPWNSCLERARELKAACMDRTDALALNAQNRRTRLAAENLASDAYRSTKDRVRAFVQRGGRCRATFFNHRGRHTVKDHPLERERI